MAIRLRSAAAFTGESVETAKSMITEIYSTALRASIAITLVACGQDHGITETSHSQEFSTSLVTVCDTTWDDQGYFATDHCISTFIVGEDTISFNENEICPFRLCIGDTKMLDSKLNYIYLMLFDCQLIKFSKKNRLIEKRIILGKDELKRDCEECSLTIIGNFIVYKCISKISIYNDNLVLIYNSEKHGVHTWPGYLTYSHPQLYWDSHLIYITHYATDPLDSLVILGVDTIRQ